MFTEVREHGIGAAGFLRASLDTAFVALSSKNIYVMKATARVAT